MSIYLNYSGICPESDIKSSFDLSYGLLCFPYNKKAPEKLPGQLKQLAVVKI